MFNVLRDYNKFLIGLDKMIAESKLPQITIDSKVFNEIMRLVFVELIDKPLSAYDDPSNENEQLSYDEAKRRVGIDRDFVVTQVSIDEQNRDGKRDIEFTMRVVCDAGDYIRIVFPIFGL
jgi:hypothetical protein